MKSRGKLPQLDKKKKKKQTKKNYKNPTADITTLNGEKLAFQMRSGIRQGYSLSPFLSNIIFIKLPLFTVDIVVYRKSKSKNLTKSFWH